MSTPRDPSGLAGRPPDPAPDPPRAQAVALRYDGADTRAPAVVAKGRHEVAERILQAARRHGIPVREDPELLALLSACELGQEIPVELFTAVAELLAYFYRLNQELAPSAPDAHTRPA